MDLTELFDEFYDNIWNIATAQGYGLDVWGRILGVTRVLQLPAGGNYLGFEEAGTAWSGFGQDPFYTGETITSNYMLSDADFRVLLYAKAMANITDGSIPSLNAILLTLFPPSGGVVAWVGNTGNMQIVYNFSVALNAVQLAIVESSGVLPNPPGVAITIAQGVTPP